MEWNKLVIPIVGITVSIICLATILMPVLDDTTATNATFTNDGYYYMQKITANDARQHTLFYDYNNGDYIFKIDGVDVSSKILDSLSTTVATDGQKWAMRAKADEYIGLQGFGTNFGIGGHNTRTVTAIFDRGTVTVTSTVLSNDEIIPGPTATNTYTELWLISSTPTDYVMKKADVPAYVLKNTQYIAAGVTEVSQWNTLIMLTGDMTGYNASIVFPPGVTTTVTDDTIVGQSMSGYVDLYKLDKLTFTISDGTNTVDATYSYFIVPAAVTAELSNHLADGPVNILLAIPVMIILVILMAAASMIMRNRE